jgi:hypothetical protein
MQTCIALYVCGQCLPALRPPSAHALRCIAWSTSYLLLPGAVVRGVELVAALTSPRSPLEDPAPTIASFFLLPALVYGVMPSSWKGTLDMVVPYKQEKYDPS